MVDFGEIAKRSDDEGGAVLEDVGVADEDAAG